jgi:fatty acyl-CoA reductase
MKTRGNVKTVIWRPSIIGSAINDPFPGWTDTLSAAGGLALLTALGLMQVVRVEGDGETAFDLVPVDYVSNGCLVATAYSAKNKIDFEIYNMATSVRNKITFAGFRTIGLRQYST